MSWRDLQRECREIFEGLRSTRPNGFTMSSDMRSVMISGYDEPVVLVVYDKDLIKLRSMIDMAIKAGGKKSRG